MTQLPSGWVLARIGDLIGRDGVFVDGDWVESKDQDPDGQVRLTQLADIGEGVFRDRSHRFLTSATAQDLRCTSLRPGDILVARMPDPLGRACIFPGARHPCVTAVDVCIIRPGEKSIEPRWLMWWINSPAFRREIVSRQAGTTRKRISRKNLAAIEFPLPPLQEQRRIGAAIEEQFSRIAASEDYLRMVSQRLKRYRVSVVGNLLAGDWPVAPLSELAVRITKGTTPTSVGYGFTSDGVLFVKAESISGGLVDHTKCAYIDDETDDALARSRLVEDDVLVTIAGTLGRVGRVRGIDIPANTNQAVSLIRLSDPQMARWVVTWLGGPGAQHYLTTMGRGVGLQNLNLKQVGATPISIPPSDERNRIVGEVERQLSVITALEERVAAGQEQTDALRRSILEKAFTGGLAPQDPTHEPASVLLERIAAARRSASSVPRQRRKVSA